MPDPNLYAFSYPDGDDPHEIQLHVDGDHQLTDDWTLVVDSIGGHEWLVRRADCGLGCRCAAEAQRR